MRPRCTLLLVEKKLMEKTEKIIGNWFRKRKNRDKIILASKISGPGMSYIRGGGPQFSKENFFTRYRE